MAAFNKFNQFVQDLHDQVHDIPNDALKVMLTNVAPIAGNEVKADLTEIGAGNGYVAGGSAMAVTSALQVGGLLTVVPTADVVFTAAGGTIGPFRYVVLYNDTPAAPLDPLISYYDRGSSLTLLDTETFTVDVGASLWTMQ